MVAVGLSPSQRMETLLVLPFFALTGAEIYVHTHTHTNATKGGSGQSMLTCKSIDHSGRLGRSYLARERERESIAEQIRESKQTVRMIIL